MSGSPLVAWPNFTANLFPFRHDPIKLQHIGWLGRTLRLRRINAQGAGARASLERDKGTHRLFLRLDGERIHRADDNRAVLSARALPQWLVLGRWRNKLDSGIRIDSLLEFRPDRAELFLVNVLRRRHTRLTNKRFVLAELPDRFVVQVAQRLRELPADPHHVLQLGLNLLSMTQLKLVLLLQPVALFDRLCLIFFGVNTLVLRTRQRVLD